MLYASYTVLEKVKLSNHAICGFSTPKVRETIDCEFSKDKNGNSDCFFSNTSKHTEKGFVNVHKIV